MGSIEHAVNFTHTPLSSTQLHSLTIQPLIHTLKRAHDLDNLGVLTRERPPRKASLAKAIPYVARMAHLVPRLKLTNVLLYYTTKPNVSHYLE